MVRRIAGAALVALAGAVAALTGTAAAQLPPQEPGVTLRTYQLGSTPNELCTIKAGTTPNVDKVLSTINWTTTDQFGASNNFLSHVFANLTVATAGEHTFRLSSDDGSRLKINGNVVIDHDGPHGADPPKDGVVTLTAGVHTARHRLLRPRQRPGPQAGVEAAGSVELRSRPDLGAEHGLRRRARRRAGQQVLRGREPTRPATACGWRRSTRTTRSRTCARRASSRGWPRSTSCRTAGWPC